MDMLLNITISCFTFGCGWVVGRLFFADESKPDEPIDSKSESERTVDLKFTGDPKPVGTDKPNRVKLLRSRKPRVWRQQRGRHQRSISDKKERRIETFNKHYRCKHRRGRISTKKEQGELLVYFKKNTDFLEKLNTTLTNLNDTLKDKAEDVLSHSPTSSTCEALSPSGLRTECFARKPIESETEVVASPGNSEQVVFPPKSHYPDIGGRCKDRSAAMHIYDADFKAPKCSNSWTLETSGSENLGAPSANKDFISDLNKEKTSSLNELRVMFQDCRNGNSDYSNNPDGVNMITKPGGGYASMGDLNKKKKEQEITLDVKSHPKKIPREKLDGSVKKQILSRGDELDIINSFSSIKGMGWGEALNLAQEQGYHLHATYINELPNLASEYSKTVLGVKVKDINFDCGLGSDAKGLSEEAVVTAVIDVGGQDMHKRGL